MISAQTASDDGVELQSGISIPPGERPLGEIAAWVAAHHPDRPWTCAVHRGTDGAHVFRGGVGHSLVIDPAGRLWRARSYEDFETTYEITPQTCTIATLTPLCAQMREYLPR